jgi:hypothetical protein
MHVSCSYESVAPCVGTDITRLSRASTCSTSPRAPTRPRWPLHQAVTTSSFAHRTTRRCDSPSKSGADPERRARSTPGDPPQVGPGSRGAPSTTVGLDVSNTHPGVWRFGSYAPAIAASSLAPPVSSRPRSRLASAQVPAVARRPRRTENPRQRLWWARVPTAPARVPLRTSQARKTARTARPWASSCGASAMAPASVAFSTRTRSALLGGATKTRGRHLTSLTGPLPLTWTSACGGRQRRPPSGRTCPPRCDARSEGPLTALQRPPPRLAPQPRIRSALVRPAASEKVGRGGRNFALPARAGGVAARAFLAARSATHRSVNRRGRCRDSWDSRAGARPDHEMSPLTTRNDSPSTCNFACLCTLNRDPHGADLIQGSLRQPCQE